MSMSPDLHLFERAANNFLWPVVVAGGALRDMYFDKPVNDLDVFVAVSASAFTRVKEKGEFWLNEDFNPDSSASALSLGHFIIEGSAAYENSDFLSARSDDLPGYNIILSVLTKRTKPTLSEEVEELVEDLFKEFPCNISKIAWSPITNTLYKDYSFELGVTEKKILFTRDCNPDYMCKIRSKYDNAAFKGLRMPSAGWSWDWY